MRLPESRSKFVSSGVWKQISSSGKRAAIRTAVRAVIGAAVGFVFFLPSALAHNLSASNADFVAAVNGPAIPLFIYLGAKHMVTGVDHVLYLLAVVFFLFKPRQIFTLVTLFALGHSVSLIAGVGFSIQLNSSVVDALIGLSVAYKAFENLGGFTRISSYLPSVGVAVFGFGLIHGLGLATKLQSVYGGGDGFLANLIAFNVGVEVGQLIALAILLTMLYVLRKRHAFQRWSFVFNFGLLVSGFVLAGYHWLDLSLTSEYR